MGVETSKEPTLTWTVIAVSEIRSPRSDGRMVKEANQQSLQTGYGDKRQTQDGEAVQVDNTHSTGVSSARSEEPERGAVGGSDAWNNGNAPCVERRPDVEKSMNCGDEI